MAYKFIGSQKKVKNFVLGPSISKPYFPIGSPENREKARN